MSARDGEAATAHKPTIRILGGGPSGLSAAFHLTSPRTNPGWQDRYDVVIHQMGWRLGGKGATGRNADAAGRIEEHGIHLFANMYTNALHMMKESLDELADASGRTAMDDEFLASNFQMVADFFDGRWHGFEGQLPHNSEVPWNVQSDLADPKALVESLFETVRGILEGKELPIPGRRPTPESESGWWHRVVHAVTSAFRRDVGKVLSGLFDTLESETERIIGSQHWSLDDADLASKVEPVLAVMEKLLADIDHALSTIADTNDRLRWVFLQLDLLTTSIRGALADGVFTNGLDTVDGKSCREWLQEHGASDITLSSAIIEAIPNTCMQYPGGDSTVPPTMAASGFLTFLLRQMAAPGNAAYAFRVSTGETVILPIYQTLLDRGVRFEFFNKVHNLVPSADGKRIGAFTVEHQATPVGGHYDPLVTLADGQRVWPSQAKFDDLVEGPELRDRKINLESWWADWQGPISTVELAPGDQLIVALPPAAQKIVCREAADAATKRHGFGWSAMLDNVQTTATQAVQIWLSQTTEDLGWPHVDGTGRVIGPTFNAPIPAYADFSEAIRYEDWPTNDQPKGLIYFCGALQDPVEIPGFDQHDYPDREQERVKHMATQYLRSIGGLLPYASNNGVHANSLDFSLLHCHDESTAGVGENRVAQQYYRANIDPNERFTLSVPGTLQYRLKAWESGYDNCALSSDAIYTGFNLGSFEGAVMGGMLASLTISGAPTLADIYGYEFLHPDTPQPPEPFLNSKINLDEAIDLRKVQESAADEKAK